MPIQGASAESKRATEPTQGPANRVSGIPFFRGGEGGAPVVFLHANGFPPACYEPLLDSLSTHYQLTAMSQRPLWPNARPEALSDWHLLSSDLLQFLDEQGSRRVVAVGHSMGAIAALRAALWAPERFSALVLLEPVLLPRLLMLEWTIVRALGLGSRLHPLIPGAMRRQRTFESLETAFQRYRSRPVFRYFSDRSLRAYIAGMTQSAADGLFRLVYSPEWEARIYDTGGWNDWDLWRGISSLSVPTLLVRGAESDTLRESVTGEVERRNPRVRIAVLEGATHLLPLERPEATLGLIRSFLGETLEGTEPRADQMAEGEAWNRHNTQPQS